MTRRCRSRQLTAGRLVLKPGSITLASAAAVAETGVAPFSMQSRTLAEPRRGA
jgi:hypothetical protein